MAAGLIVVPGAQPSRGRNGGAVTAELRFYANESTTPVTVYVDPELTTAHEHPILSDSAGRFPFIWADTASLFTATWSTGDGQSKTWDGIGASVAADATIAATVQAAADRVEAIAAEFADLDDAITEVESAAAEATTAASAAAASVAIAQGLVGQQFVVKSGAYASVALAVAAALGSGLPLYLAPGAAATLTVPGNFASPQLALAAIAAWDIPGGASVNIVVTGHLALVAPVTLAHKDAARISITGQALLARTFASVTSVTGAAGAYTVRVPLNDYTNVAVGDCVAITGTTGAAGNELLRGGWPITAVSAGVYIEFLCTAQRGTIPTGVVGGTVKVYRTVLSFTGCDGVQSGMVGGLNQLALRGNGTASTFGFDSRDRGDVVMNDVIVHGFGDDGISPRNGVGVIGTRVYATGNGNNGFNARESGAALKLDACIASGNGNATTFAASGGSGIQAQFSGSMELNGGCEAWGNYGDGFKSRNGASGISDNASPLKAGWNYHNFRAGQNGMLQAVSAIGKSAIDHDFYVETGGYGNFTLAESYSAGGSSFYCTDARMTVANAKSTGAAGNAYTASGGRMDARSAMATSPTFNGFSAASGFIDATNSNVVSCGASAYISTGRKAEIISTGAAGLTTRNPAVNTYDANYNTVAA